MYRVRLQDFEGPLDLLLFFIQRDELDIYDIPIARITDEFLGYVRLLEEIDLDGAADFIYMATLLISIKARMLLPRPELDDDGEPIDPRRELVERLLEYIRYKEAAQTLGAFHEQRGDFFTRGQAGAQREAFEEAAPETYSNTSLFALVGALRRVLTEAEEEPVHAVGHPEYAVETQQEYVREQLRKQGRLTFVALARHRHKGFIISTFLAVLEMARWGEVSLTMTPAGDDFFVTPAEPTTATNGTA